MFRILAEDVRKEMAENNVSGEDMENLGEYRTRESGRPWIGQIMMRK